MTVVSDLVVRIRRLPTTAWLALAVVVGATGWCAADAQRVGVAWWHYLMTLVLVGLVTWGCSGIVLRAMNWPTFLCAPIARLAIGSSFLCVLPPLFALIGLSTAASFLILVIGIVGLRSNRPEFVTPPESRSVEWAVLAITLWVASRASEFVSEAAGSVKLTQYWDLTWHLAMIKDGLLRGLPLAQSPLLAGAPAPSYHPAFDDWAIAVVQGMYLPVAPALFSIVLPLTAVFFVAAVSAATGALVRSHRAMSIAPMVFGAILLMQRLPEGVRSAVGDGGLGDLRYFAWNPPAMLGAVAAATSVALVAASDESESSTARLLWAALLAGAVVMFKANTALAIAPAFGLLVCIRALRRKETIRNSAAVLGLLVVSFAVCYLTTRGASVPMAVQFGEYSRWLQQNALRSGPAIMRAMAVSSDRWGSFGDALFLVAQAALLSFGWRLLPASGLLARRSDPKTAASGDGLVYIGLICACIFLVSATLVQPDTGRFTAWNIAAHTFANLLWIGLVPASAGFYRFIEGEVEAPSAEQWSLLIVAAMLVLASLAVPGVVAIRQVGTAAVPTGLYRLLERIPEEVPADAIVAQNFDTERDAWVSGVAGRRTVIERGASYQPYAPEEATRRLNAIAGLYGAASPEEAIGFAREYDVEYAIVGPNEGKGIRAAGEPVLSEDGWVLIQLP